MPRCCCCCRCWGGAPLRDIYVAKRMHELDRVPGDRPPARKTRRTVLYCTVLPDGHLRGQPKCRCCTDGEGPKQGIRPPPLQENILMQKDDHSLFACANPDRLGASPLHVRQQTVYVVATTSSYFFDVLAIPPGQADEAAVRGGGGRDQSTEAATATIVATATAAVLPLGQTSRQSS